MDAGKDWRTLKVHKHRSMNTLATEFAKQCVNINNAKAELLKSENDAVPRSVIIKKEKCSEPTA